MHVQPQKPDSTATTAWDASVGRLHGRQLSILQQAPVNQDACVGWCLVELSLL